MPPARSAPPRPLTPRARQRWLLVGLLSSVHLSSLLELLDFPPIGDWLDAHALWHACTPAATVLWYRFLDLDMKFYARGDRPPVAGSAAAAAFHTSSTRRRTESSTAAATTAATTKLS